MLSRQWMWNLQTESVRSAVCLCCQIASVQGHGEGRESQMFSSWLLLMGQSAFFVLIWWKLCIKMWSKICSYLLYVSGGKGYFPPLSPFNLVVQQDFPLRYFKMSHCASYNYVFLSSILSFSFPTKLWAHHKLKLWLLCVWQSTKQWIHSKHLPVTYSLHFKMITCIGLPCQSNGEDSHHPIAVGVDSILKSARCSQKQKKEMTPWRFFSM